MTPGAVNYVGDNRYLQALAEAERRAGEVVMSSAALLDDRGRTHGVFAVGAVKALELQAATVPGEQETAVMMFARQMICAKLARIVCGDPGFEDHWRDIAGYATLVADSLKAE